MRNTLLPLLLFMSLAFAAAAPDAAHARKEDAKKSAKAAQVKKDRRSPQARRVSADGGIFAETRHSANDNALSSLNQALPAPKGVLTRKSAAPAMSTPEPTASPMPDPAQDRRKMIEELAGMNDSQLEKAKQRALSRVISGRNLSDAEKARLQRDYAEFYDTLKVLSPQQRREYIKSFQ